MTIERKYHNNFLQLTNYNCKMFWVYKLIKNEKY